MHSTCFLHLLFRQFCYFQQLDDKTRNYIMKCSTTCPHQSYGFMCMCSSVDRYNLQRSSQVALTFLGQPFSPQSSLLSHASFSSVVQNETLLWLSILTFPPSMSVPVPISDVCWWILASTEA